MARPPRALTPSRSPWTGRSINTAGLILPYVVALTLHGEDGTLIAEVEHDATESFEAGRYTLNPNASMKVYLRVTDGVTVTTVGDGMLISIDGVTTVQVGARSYHEEPPGHITVTGS